MRRGQDLTLNLANNLQVLLGAAADRYYQPSSLAQLCDQARRGLWCRGSHQNLVIGSVLRKTNAAVAANNVNVPTPQLRENLVRFRSKFLVALNCPHFRSGFTE